MIISAVTKSGTATTSTATPSSTTRTRTSSRRTSSRTAAGPRQARVHALAAGPLVRRPDREGQALLLRLLRGELPGPRELGPPRRTTRPGRRPSGASSRSTSGTSTSPFRATLAFGKLSAILGGGLDARRLGRLPARDRHPGLRRPDERPGGRQHQERRRERSAASTPRSSARFLNEATLSYQQFSGTRFRRTAASSARTTSG